MTDNSAKDRRALERIRCTGRPAARKGGSLHVGRRSYSVSLMDLHAQGARLRFMDLSSTAAVDAGDDCRLKARMELPGLNNGPVPCAIIWKMGAELGIRFLDDMTFGPDDIRRLLDG